MFLIFCRGCGRLRGMNFWSILCNAVNFLRRKDVRHYVGVFCLAVVCLYHVGGAEWLLLRGVTEQYGSMAGVGVLLWLVFCLLEWGKTRLQLRKERLAVQDAERKLAALGKDEKAQLRLMVEAGLSQVFMDGGYKALALLVDAGLLVVTDRTDYVSNGHRVVQFSMTKACRHVLYVQGKAADLLGDGIGGGKG